MISGHQTLEETERVTQYHSNRGAELEEKKVRDQDAREGP